MEKSIKEPLVAVDQRIQFMWKCKYHMKIWGIDYLGPAFIYPDLFVDGLTVWTVPVTAGIIVEFCMSAVRALRDIDAELAGLAVEDGPGSFKLGIGLEMPG